MGAGLQLAESMRSLAVGDYNDDGKPDRLLTAMDARPLLLHNETATQGHWAKVRLLNKYASPAINAIARLTAGGVTQLREVRSGSTYCSQNSFDLHFGVGEASRIQVLEIHWPGPQTSVERGLVADQTHTFHQP